MKIRVEIEGVTPLLMHRFTDEAALKIQGGTTAATSAGEKGTPREQAEKFAYRDEKTGQLYIPGSWLFAAIVGAGIFKKVGKNKATTHKTSLIPAGLSVLDIAVPLGTKEFEVDSRRVVNPQSGGAVICHRPRLDRWRATFSLEVDETMFAPSFVRELVDDAGKKMGIGSYRPQRKGPFGKFVVSKWEAEKVAKAA